MNNVIYELLIPRVNQRRDQLIRILLIIFMIGLVAAAPFTNFLSLLAAVILGVVSYLLIFPKFNVEYEYTLVNHELDIDIIYNKSKRSHLFSIDLKQAELIAPNKSHRLDSYAALKTVDCSSQKADSSPYTIIIPVNQQRKQIIIQPDSCMLEYLRGILPRTFFAD